MIVQKVLNFYDNSTQGCPDDTKNCSNASGWFDMNLLETWFSKMVLPDVEATSDPENNQASYCSPKVIEACKTSRIYLSPFPTNAAYLMLAIGVVVFAPMTKKQREILDLNRLWTGDRVRQNRVTGFKAMGLHPADPTDVFKRIPDGLDAKW